MPQCLINRMLISSSLFISACLNVKVSVGRQLQNFFLGTFVESILATETTYLIELSCCCSSLLGILSVCIYVYPSER